MNGKFSVRKGAIFCWHVKIDGWNKSSWELLLSRLLWNQDQCKLKITVIHAVFGKGSKFVQTFARITRTWGKPTCGVSLWPCMEARVWWVAWPPARSGEQNSARLIAQKSSTLWLTWFSKHPWVRLGKTSELTVLLEPSSSHAPPM
jgi:hypothetical protein